MKKIKIRNVTKEQLKFYIKNVCPKNNCKECPFYNFGECCDFPTDFIENFIKLLDSEIEVI